MTSSKSGLKLSVPIQTGFLEKFDTLETLGQGTFGIVKKCRDKQTKDEFAVKIIRSRVLSSRIENETQICSQLKHPHIVRLHNVFQDDIQYYMIFDLVTGGELFEDIVKREYYSESEASKCIQQILDAVAYCHDKNIIHRDIKPENLLLKTQEANSDIKLGNFALALWIPEDVLGYHKIAGTLGYFAPEIVNKEIYGKPVDVWACGVILYILLVGYPPFWDDNEKVLSKIISEGKYEFYSPEWDSITDEAKSLINQLLKTDQSKRISAREALNHPWINYREEFASKLHHQNTIQGLKKFNARRKLKGAIISTMVSQRFGMLLNDKHKSDNTIGKPQDSQRKVSGNVSLPMLTKVGSLDEDSLNEIISLTANFCKVMAMNDSKTCGSICTGNFTKFELDLNINFGDTVQVTIINPRVKKIGSTGACISYSKLIQYVNEENTHMTHQTLETCLWENNGDVWKCVHLHSS